MKPNDGWCMQPKHEAFWITIIKCCVCLIVAHSDSHAAFSVNQRGTPDLTVKALKKILLYFYKE